MPTDATVTLLTRPGCHLCDDAREIVAEVVASIPRATLTEISIADDPALADRYAEEIPVIMINERVHNIWRVDRERLFAALPGGNTVIKHVISWTLQAADAPGKSAAFTAIAEGLGGLPHVIPELRTIHVGQDIAETDGNWDVVAILDFESTADLAAYQVHPEHQKVAAMIRSHTTGRAVVDFEF